MADRMLDKARAKRDELAREIGELDNFIKMYERLAGDEERTEIAAPPPRPRLFSRVTPTNPTSETARTVQAARALIQEAGHPVGLSIIKEKLEGAGFAFAGINPLNTLGARLSNAKNSLVTIKGHGWWLAEQPYPPAGYTPPETKPAGEQGPPAGSLV